MANLEAAVGNPLSSASSFPSSSRTLFQHLCQGSTSDTPIWIPPVVFFASRAVHGVSWTNTIKETSSSSFAAGIEEV